MSFDSYIQYKGHVCLSNLNDSLFVLFIVQQFVSAQPYKATLTD